MSNNARHYAEQNLDIAKMSEQYKITFLNLIANETGE